MQGIDSDCVNSAPILSNTCIQLRLHQTTLESTKTAQAPYVDVCACVLKQRVVEAENKDELESSEQHRPAEEHKRQKNHKKRGTSAGPRRAEEQEEAEQTLGRNSTEHRRVQNRSKADREEQS